MNRIAKRSWFTGVLSGMLIVGLLGILVRYTIYAEQWAAFSRSPYIYHTGGTPGGGQVLDRDGEMLLNLEDGRTYADSETVRRSMLHLLGDSNGYINSAILNEYGDELMGYDRFNGTYHVGESTGRIRLTLSADVQAAALNALGGRKGTVGVYNYKTGEVLCMVSSPTFDPENQPDSETIENSSDYDGVYVNRFLYATYSPGSTFKLVTAAAALENIPDVQNRTFTCYGTYDLAGEVVVCNGVHGELDLEGAIAHSCNVVFAQLSEELGAGTLTEYAKKIGITDSVEFDGITTKKGHFDLSAAGTFETAWGAIGQYTDQINPCQYMTYLGAIANGGKAALPHIVDCVTYGSSTKYSASTESTGRLIDADTADAIAEMMHTAVVRTYGEWNFAGLSCGAKTGTAERSDGQAADALMVGFSMDDSYPLAFVVFVEGGGSGSGACAPVVSAVLSACVSELG